ncbi:MAG: hypothetical protein ACWA5P_01955 [bacterium]
MTFSDLIKTTEGIVVLGSLLLTVLFGRFWAFVGAGGYLLLNVTGWAPVVWNLLSKTWSKLKGLFGA